MTEKKLSDKCEELIELREYSLKYLLKDGVLTLTISEFMNLYEEDMKELNSRWQERSENIIKGIMLSLQTQEKAHNKILEAKDVEIEELKAEIEELLIYDTKSEISIKDHKQEMHSLLDEIEKHIRKESHIFRGTITVQKAVKKIEQKRKEIEGK